MGKYFCYRKFIKPSYNMSSEGYTIKEASAARIRKTIDEATSSKDKIPGFVFVAVNKNGDEIFSHASGKRGAETKEPMTLDSVFWIASCTKMVGGIACMQLVEQGKLSLDDADLVGKLAPELKKARILDGFDEKDRPIWKEKKTGITLRHLLSHTSGLGYTFFNPELKKVGLPRGIDEFSGRIEDLDPILLFEPGSKFNYGTGIDWACVLVERVTGQSLSEYINANVFSPLSIKNMSFFPPQSRTTKEHLQLRRRRPLRPTPRIRQNHRHLAQQRHLPKHRQANPQGRNRQRDVQQPDP